ncbi:MAG: signal recognition particle-docking protein FtsY [Lactobacillus sp.]|jgi:fused signal recognition particle receptor|nr:signal recognition particle-docking protein FtsY [Lactobacillus sp.]MCH3906134.1 signal recognition particle-docking protein FtsY [Lactobacillus sp.]MCH3990290.1 signal recognition particle-docking protein FtsY [Lactobacillus sp.]MCH4068996.1 signal recognition particle-docking protein FtsY [Lactobacillus sp.]MCI1303398.1 signal recognition particle-docking protein FtsY [Lactobacillus sp.]
MGLFDRIKKSLFSQPEAESTEKDKQAEAQQSTEADKSVNSEEKKVEPATADEKKPLEAEPAAELTKEQESAEAKPEPEQVEATGEAKEDHDQQEQLYEQGLAKTSSSFGSKLNAFFANFRSVDDDFFDDLEELLIESDVGVDTAEKLTDQLKQDAKLNKAKTKAELKATIVQGLVKIYAEGGDTDQEKLAYDPAKHPNVYLFVGVNGSGKTTTIGKLATRFQKEGKKVMLAAADTFRAGAVEQLQRWGEQAGVPVVTGPAQADPASVVYDACEQAKAGEYDYLLVDTAGRLQNKVNLMNELAKIQRTIKKLLPDQPAETLLVLDGSTGQNALLQAKDFDKTTKLTGLVLTKLDGSSKGGVVLAIRSEMKLPVKLVGLGEHADQLADFDAEAYAVGLFHDLV